MSKLYQCPAYLFCNYELLELSTYKIAKECGVRHNTIPRWLRKFNIRIRTKNETQRGKHWFWSEESKKKMSKARKGQKHSEETKKKLSIAKIGKKNPMYGRTGKKAPMYGKTGENSPRWKGNNVKDLTIHAMHKRIRKQKPKPTDGKCEICGKVADYKGRTELELSNIKNHNYTLNPDDYMYAHHSCHNSYDADKRRGL